MAGEGGERGVAAIVQRVLGWRPVRVAQHYAATRGPILASGLAYQSVFAAFAGIWVGFSIAGLVISGDIGLRAALIDYLAQTVPGLIDADGNGGAIDPDELLRSEGFTVAGTVALIGLLITAIGWLGSARDAVRVQFDLPQLAANFFLLKLRDLGLGIAFGLALILTAALSVAGTTATGLLLDLVGIGSDSLVGAVVGRIATLTVMFALDTVTLGVLYRVLSGLRVPWARLRAGALLGATGLGVLKVVGGALLGGGGTNPLLASFAVIVGLLIYFNLSCQVILFAAAWVATGMRDRGLVIDPEVERQRLEEARRLVAAQDPAPPGPRTRRDRLRAGLRRLRRRLARGVAAESTGRDDGGPS